MPIHDWARVDAGTFHGFHTAWITHLSEALNGISKEKKLRQAKALQKFANALWTAVAGHRNFFFNPANRKSSFSMVAVAA